MSIVIHVISFHITISNGIEVHKCGNSEEFDMFMYPP